MMWNIYRPESDESIDLLEDIEQEKKLILHNDDYNTFDWVIQSLIEVCDHTSEQAEQCAYIIHYKGECQVKHGPESEIRHMQRIIQNRGLSATID